jgi:hypothetical protein
MLFRLDPDSLSVVFRFVIGSKDLCALFRVSTLTSKMVKDACDKYLEVAGATVEQVKEDGFLLKRGSVEEKKEDGILLERGSCLTRRCFLRCVRRQATESANRFRCRVRPFDAASHIRRSKFPWLRSQPTAFNRRLRSHHAFKAAGWSINNGWQGGCRGPVDLDALTAMVEEGVDLNGSNIAGTTLLWVSCRHAAVNPEGLRVVKHLLQLGVSPNAVNVGGDYSGLPAAFVFSQGVIPQHLGWNRDRCLSVLYFAGAIMEPNYPTWQHTLIALDEEAHEGYVAWGAHDRGYGLMKGTMQEELGHLLQEMEHTVAFYNLNQFSF